MNFYIKSVGIDRYKVYNNKVVVVGECATPYVDEIRHLLITNKTINKGQKISVYWFDKLNKAEQ